MYNLDQYEHYSEGEDKYSPQYIWGGRIAGIKLLPDDGCMLFVEKEGVEEQASFKASQGFLRSQNPSVGDYLVMDSDKLMFSIDEDSFYERYGLSELSSVSEEKRYGYRCMFGNIIVSSKKEGYPDRFGLCLNDGD